MLRRLLIAWTTQHGEDFRSQALRAGYRPYFVQGSGSGALTGLLASIRQAG